MGNCVRDHVPIKPQTPKTEPAKKDSTKPIFRLRRMSSTSIEDRL